jgi:hypothetical protein
MPTLKQRHMITETDRIAEGINLAARIWPVDEAERAALLRHLIETGIVACEAKIASRRAERLQALEELDRDAEFFNNLWPKNWREDQLAGWPE